MALLTRELGPTTRFQPHITGAGALSGLVISDAFDGLDQLERLRHLNRLFDEYLSEEDRADMLALLTLTPEEASDGSDTAMRAS